MARFFANRVVDKRTTYLEIPSQLKLAVKEILITEGHGDLVVE